MTNISSQKIHIEPQSFLSYIEKFSEILSKIDSGTIEKIELAIVEIHKTFTNNGKLLVCGNGGSAADSQHIAAEFINGMTHPNNLHLPAISLATDSSILTSHSNDYSFATVFSIQIDAIGKFNDVLLALSTSGKSINILNALSSARHMGMRTISITGSNSEVANLSDVNIQVPSINTQHVQELTLMIEHFICETVISKIRSSINV